MKIIGLMPVRNEAWCLRLTLPAAAKWLDGVVVLDHASTDATPDIIEQAEHDFQGVVHRLYRRDQQWREREDRQTMLDMGKCLGGTHFVLLDVDEIVTPNLTGHIRATANSILPGHARTLPWLHLWRSTDQYRCDNSPFGRAWCKFIFTHSPKTNYSSITRGGGGSNVEMHCRFPAACFEQKWTSLADQGGVLHLHHVVWERAIWKQIWYQMEEVLRFGKVIGNYAPTVNENGIILKKLPEKWSGDIDFSLLDLDVEPWQKSECKRLLSSRGEEVFRVAGVNFFGIL